MRNKDCSIDSVMIIDINQKLYELMEENMM